MRAPVNLVLAWSVIAALQSGLSIARAAELEPQIRESQWVPSIAITSGVTWQQQTAAQAGYRFPGTNPTVPVPIRDSRFGSDRVVTPYVGYNFELLTDRKSTRLNSSHLGISYAVFCLK